MQVTVYFGDSASAPENWSNVLVLQDTRYQCIWCHTTFGHLGSANRHLNERRCRMSPRDASPAMTTRKRRSESGEVRRRHWHDEISFEG